MEADKGIRRITHSDGEDSSASGVCVPTAQRDIPSSSNRQVGLVRPRNGLDSKSKTTNP